MRVGASPGLLHRGLSAALQEAESLAPTSAAHPQCVSATQGEGSVTSRSQTRGHGRRLPPRPNLKCRLHVHLVSYVGKRPSLIPPAGSVHPRRCPRSHGTPALRQGWRRLLSTQPRATRRARPSASTPRTAPDETHGPITSVNRARPYEVGRIDLQSFTRAAGGSMRRRAADVDHGAGIARSGPVAESTDRPVTPLSSGLLQRGA